MWRSERTCTHPHSVTHCIPTPGIISWDYRAGTTVLSMSPPVEIIYFLSLPQGRHTSNISKTYARLFRNRKKGAVPSPEADRPGRGHALGDQGAQACRQRTQGPLRAAPTSKDPKRTRTRARMGPHMSPLQRKKVRLGAVRNLSPRPHCQPRWSRDSGSVSTPPQSDSCPAS